MENILSVKNLCKNYKTFSLKDVSFSLPKGYIMGFIGQNGAGKTTTIRSILNMAKTDSGEISVFGLDSVNNSVEIKKKIGVVFDDIYFAAHLTPLQVESQLKGFYDGWDSEKFSKYLTHFELPKTEEIGKFSRGMKMKLMLSVALSYDTDLLILDEPTSGLDPVARDDILDILAQYIEDGTKSVLFSTHITSDLERIADYITVIKSGEIWFSSDKDELLEKYVIIKGDKDLLTNEIKNICEGVRTYRNGFEALVDTKKLSQITIEYEQEKANLDEILIFISKEDELK